MTRPLTLDQKRYGAILKAQGFTREGVRAMGCVTWVREEPGGRRKLDVQLWDDGVAHRVSSTVRDAIHAYNPCFGRSSAAPSAFTNGLELLAAIAHQQVVDHPHLRPPDKSHVLDALAYGLGVAVLKPGKPFIRSDGI